VSATLGYALGAVLAVALVAILYAYTKGINGDD